MSVSRLATQLDEQALALRAKGLTYRQIAERMGESYAKVWKRCNRQRERATTRTYKKAHRNELKAYNQRYALEHRGTCRQCKGPMGVRRDGLCIQCIREAAEQKARATERLWAEGKTLAEIQQALGLPSLNAVKTHVRRCRDAGYDLPRRRR